MQYGAITDALFAASGTGKGSGALWIAGAQLGAQWQVGSFIFGAEFELDRLRYRATSVGTGALPYGLNAKHTISSELEASNLALLRGRLGWSTSALMFYTTAGLAIADLRVTSSFRDDNLSNNAIGMMDTSSTARRLGWTIGGGVEWALSKSWSLRGDYTFVKLQSISSRGTITHADFIGQFNYLTIAADLDLHLVRAGLNYRF